MTYQSFKRPLTLALLASTLIVITAQADFTVVIPEGAPRKTSVDANITISPTGSILTAGVPVVMDSGSKLILEANNITAVGGLQSTGAAGVTADLNAAGGSITVGKSAIIKSNTSPGVSLNVANSGAFSIDNTGSILGEAAAQIGIYALDVTQLTIANRNGGLISGGDDGVRIQVVGGTTTLDLVNEEGGTIRTKDNINSSSAIELIGNTKGAITNSGRLEVAAVNKFGSAGIAIYNGGSSVIIKNTATGVIESGSEGIHYYLASLNNVVDIQNAGAINTGLEGILFDGKGSGTIQNQSTGTITSGTDGIWLRNTFDGTITNDGTITSKLSGIYQSNGTANSLLSIINNGTIISNNAGVEGGIHNNTSFTGNILNSSTGVITATGAGNVGIRLDAGITGNVTNDGVINADNHALSLSGNMTGNILNTKTMNQTLLAGGSAVRLQLAGPSILTGVFENRGDITSVSNTSPTVSIEGLVTGGFLNSGNITATNFATAIDMTNASTTSYTQTAGTVTGAIRGSDTAANVLTFTGGTVNGAVTLGIGAFDILNIQNTSVTGILSALNANATMNVTGPFTSVASINGFKNLNVNNAGTVFVSGDTINMAGGGFLIIDQGAVMRAKEDITSTTFTFASVFGALVLDDDVHFNLGVGSALVMFPGDLVLNRDELSVTGVGVALSDTAKLTTTTLVGGVGADYGFLITDNTEYGKIISSSAGSDVTGDTISTQITGEGFIQDGHLYTLIDNSGFNLIGNGTVLFDQPASQTISFALNNLGISDVTLRAVRNPFALVADTLNATLVGTAIDSIITSPTLHPDIKLAINQIDIQPSRSEVTQALEALAPIVDGGLVQMSQTTHNKAMNMVVGRLDEARSLFDFLNPSAGDVPYFGIGAWMKAFTTRLSQQTIGEVKGYTGASSGATFGFDKMLSQELTAGVALTYATGDIEGKAAFGNEQDFSSYQVTMYGAWDVDGPWFVDGLVTGALNSYKTNRQIAVGAFQRTALSSFKAWQYSARIDSGYTFAYEKYRIVPMLGMQVGFLDVDSYTETGAGGLNLAIAQKSVFSSIGSVGLRFYSVQEKAGVLFVPESRFMAHYDFSRDRQFTSSNFVGNGEVYFNTYGFKPDPLVYNVGVGLTGYGDGMSFSVNYDLEFKHQYLGHSGFLRVRYEW